MLTTLFILLFSVFTLSASDVWSSGGVATDWALYDPKPVKQVQSTVNLVPNGSFEMPGTDFKGRKGKGFWTGGARTHGKNNAPGFAEFRDRYIQSTIRRINPQSAADGKCSLLLKTPDEVASWYSPLPQMSNRVTQLFTIPASKADQLYRLTIKTKGYHKPTAPNRGLFLIQLRPMKGAKNKFTPAGKGLQQFFTLTADWSNRSFDVRFPGGCTAVNLTLCLYGVGEACVDDIRLFPLKAGKEPVIVKAIPYDRLDNTFCFGENLPGVINFAFHADNRKFKRKNMALELELPEGFQVIDARNICPVKQISPRVWHVGLMEALPNALRRSWYAQHGIYVMIKSTLPASEKNHIARYRLIDGKWKGSYNTIAFKVLPAFKGTQPRLFRTSAMLNNEWNFEKAGVKEITDFYKTTGFNAIFGAKGPLAEAMKKAGFPRYLQSSQLANGFKIGADPKPDFAQFKMIDGKHFPGHICPVEVYTRGSYYKEKVYDAMMKALIADQDATDHFLVNWEPYYLDSKGCFCNRCRDEFIQYAKGNPSREEVLAVWPKELLVKYSDDYFKFRSIQHGKVVKTLHQDVTAIGRKAGKESLFIPEVSWKCLTKEHNRYCRQYNVKEFMHDLKWLNFWGPYQHHTAGKRYVYRPATHLISYVTGGMVRDFMKEHSSKGKLPKLLFFPHAYQGDDTITEPEALAFETLTCFVRGFNGSFCYYFPRGYDYRHFLAMAKTNTVIARYENFTQLGSNDNTGVTLTPVTPVPEKLYYAPGWEEPKGGKGMAPGLSKLGILQFQVWRYNKEMLICAGNFWQKGEVFFRLSVKGLASGRKYGVTADGQKCGNFTAKELEAGILMQTGALRWRFITVGAPHKGNADFDQKAMQKLLAARLPQIKKCVAWEKEHYKKISSYAASDTPKNDFSALKSCSNAGVTVAPAGKSLKVTAPAYTLTLEPGQGGRIHQWQTAGETLVTSRPKLGYAVPAVWYPAEAAFLLRTGMRIENISKSSNGVEVRLSRTLSARDKVELAGLKLELTHLFTAAGISSTVKITNQFDDGVEFAFRYHNMIDLLGKRGRTLGKLSFGSGELFHRSFVQKFIRLSESDPLLEKAYKRTKHISTAKSLPVTLHAPWSKAALEIDFAPRPHSIMIWDEERMDCSTFEPVFQRVMLAPGQAVTFSMTAKIRQNFSLPVKK